MSFARSTARRSSTDTVVHAVGQRVYVNRPASGRGYVQLMDEPGTTAIGKLEDGVEVMVVGWRPRGANGTRYHVRCTADGLEGWLAAAELRRAPTVVVQPVAPVEPVTGSSTPASPVRDPKPRFGRR